MDALTDLLPLLIPVAAFLVAYRAWDRRGRDPKERSIMVRWDPPDDLSPAEAGTLVDHDPGIHDLIATLVELAVRGYIVIDGGEREAGASRPDYTLHLMRPGDEWDELLPHQRRFLQGLFKRREEAVEGLPSRKVPAGGWRRPDHDAPEGAVASVDLASLRNEFYTCIRAVKDEIFDRLVAGGHYLERPDRVRGKWFVAAGLMLVLAVIGLTTISADRALGLVLTASAAVSAVILGAFGVVMPARTERGARTREAALGFKQFLADPEAPGHRERIEPGQFERFLPFAVAFRCQEAWARAFDDVVTEPPRWYRTEAGAPAGAGAPAEPSAPSAPAEPGASAFAAALGDMAAVAGEIMASRPAGRAGA